VGKRFKGRALSMAKTITKYICQACGYESPRWVGKCPNCEEWNTFAEEFTKSTKATRGKSRVPVKEILPLAQVKADEEPRIVSTINEFNRVLGGGIVKGSTVLIGGDPGIGKSTLMLQMADSLKNKIILYVTGEESLQQLKLRSERLNIKSGEKIFPVAETDLDTIGKLITSTSPDVVVVDSIQTMYRSEFESSPGSVGQVRESTAMLSRIAKDTGIPVFLIGHVTKEGVIAGPKVIEHMVDTVIQFEGERHHAFRILRCVKNRFGSTNEIGIFEMHDNGLGEVKNPSEVFLSERIFGASGSAVVSSIEGSRPLLIEVQALVSPTNYGMPQRNTTGFDYRRLTLLLAVLEKRVGVLLSTHDVFVNLVGGIKIDEPAIDLGIASAIVSSLRDTPIDSQTVAVGEVGLGGEIRAVNQPERRIQEAEKLGFNKVIIPKNNLRNIHKSLSTEIIGVETIDEALKILIG
jgi:DNA repair protein RadA/Sms